MLSIVYQTNSGHRAASLYNESNAQSIQMLHPMRRTFMLIMLCTNFQVFAHFVLQSSPMKFYFWYLSCKNFPEITHQCILFAPLSLHFNPFCTARATYSGHFLHLKHFEATALLCVVKGILLDIGRNLWHSLVGYSKGKSVIFPTH